MTEHPTHPDPSPPNEPAPKNPTAPESKILTDRWPALHAAMQNYKQQIAADFSALAYRCVSDGIIRLDDRRRLAKAARRANIRPFDAQLLIACAIRQKTLDHGPPRAQSPRKTPTQPPRKKWPAYALAASLLTLEALLAWLFFS